MRCRCRDAMGLSGLCEWGMMRPNHARRRGPCQRQPQPRETNGSRAHSVPPKPISVAMAELSHFPSPAVTSASSRPCPADLRVLILSLKNQTLVSLSCMCALQTLSLLLPNSQHVCHLVSFNMACPARPHEYEIQHSQFLHEGPQIVPCPCPALQPESSYFHARGPREAVTCHLSLSSPFGSPFWPSPPSLASGITASADNKPAPTPLLRAAGLGSPPRPMQVTGLIIRRAW